MKPLLEVKNLSFEKNGKVILGGINLAIYPEEIHSILGMNGTGKTTLASMIMGLGGYRPSHGYIYFDGTDITNLPVHERAGLKITMAWQEPARFEGITVREYLSIGIKKWKNDIDPGDCLRQVGLDPDRYLTRNVDITLSGGERKRIELASVLAMKPRLTILDEPDSGIDSLSIDYIKDVIRTLVTQGASVLLITHQDEVAAMADRTTAFCGGKILKTGTPEEVTRFFRNHCKPCTHVNEPIEEVFTSV
ncbi:MAG: ABC transporter ATP-binding protein [Spirochaetota bacterium]